MNKKYAILVLLIALGFSRLMQAQTPTDSLVGYWSFNGNANDESENKFDGTVNGASLSEDRYGTTESAYSFNGVDDYIDLGDVSALDSLSEISFSFWMYPTFTSGAGCPISKFSGTTGDWKRTFTVIYNKSTDELYIWFFDGKDSDRIGFFVSESRIDQWLHVAIAWDGTAGTCELYVNGVSKTVTKTYYESLPGNIEFIAPTESNLFIGAGNTPTLAWPFKGKIDDVRIFNKALGSSEITALYQENTLTEITPTDNVNTVKVYPNPANDYVIINTGNYNEMPDCNLQIVNIFGQTVFENLINQTEIQISVNKFGVSGIYFIKLFDDRGTLLHTRKLILQ